MKAVPEMLKATASPFSDVNVARRSPKLNLNSFTMLLDRVEANVATGTWTEDTDQGGYYNGARYSGAIQLLIEPSGHRMSGSWVGYGRSFDVNTGPWQLDLVSSDTGKQAMERYSRPPEPAND